MASTPSTKRSTYPGPSDLSESIRLKAQHDLLTSALGGLVLCPIDLSRPNLRILESGTGSGIFLQELHDNVLAARQNTSTLTPSTTAPVTASATLVGTDITRFPTLPEYIQWHRQDIRDEWPSTWHGGFDLVLQRSVMANTRSVDEAVGVVRRLAGLVKPGGWIQLIDGHMPVTPVEQDDPASTRFLKLTGKLLAESGLNPDMGSRVEELLRGCVAGNGVGGVELEEVRGVRVQTRIGKGVAGGEDGELRKAGRVWVSGMRGAMGPFVEMKGQGIMGREEFEKLMDEVEEEAETKGFDLDWWAAWGRRKA